MANQCFDQKKKKIEFRLNPYHLLQTITYLSLKNSNQIICSLNEKSVFIKIDEPSSLSRFMPITYFKGIAARIVETLSGKRAITLELFHSGEEVCIPLLISRDLKHVLLYWRLWADLYGLPMLMINEDDSIVAVKDRSSFRRFFRVTSSHYSRKGFLLRSHDLLGLRLIIANRNVLQ
ncbi:DUF6101 family protein [Bartonella bacilliformis]|uniref:Uncharacterized protein n=1 Tax=Bartonella bacilliformis Ver097 TaxID=1293911 RepID=A0A072R2N4_BARBA|nr:DUF6101 family protein [Bartonella bacilliformis]KEG19911.1 hypothetical protein H710_00505 [Bartonella bacilliformis Ver097]